MPSQDNTNVVNLQELKEIMDDDMELIGECFEEFIKDWPGLYVEIKTAVMEKNARNLNESAHKLKGTLRYLAADAAADAAFVLETAGKDNDMEGLEPKLEDLKNKCQQLVEYINNFDA